jgi:hypothetical protein
MLPDGQRVELYRWLDGIRSGKADLTGRAELTQTVRQALDLMITGWQKLALERAAQVLPHRHQLTPEVITKALAQADLLPPRLHRPEEPDMQLFQQLAVATGLHYMYGTFAPDSAYMPKLFELLALEVDQHGHADLGRLKERVRDMRAGVLLPAGHGLPRDSVVLALKVADRMRNPFASSLGYSDAEWFMMRILGLNPRARGGPSGYGWSSCSSC